MPDFTFTQPRPDFSVFDKDEHAPLPAPRPFSEWFALAVADTRAAATQPDKYELRMDKYAFRFSAEMPCMVCVAGAMLLENGGLPNEPGVRDLFARLPEAVRDLLIAINFARFGALHEACEMLCGNPLIPPTTHLQTIRYLEGAFDERLRMDDLATDFADSLRFFPDLDRIASRLVELGL